MPMKSFDQSQFLYQITNHNRVNSTCFITSTFLSLSSGMGEASLNMAMIRPAMTLNKPCAWCCKNAILGKGLQWVQCQKWGWEKWFNFISLMVFLSKILFKLHWFLCKKFFRWFLCDDLFFLHVDPLENKNKNKIQTKTSNKWTCAHTHSQSHTCTKKK